MKIGTVLIEGSTEYSTTYATAWALSVVDPIGPNQVDKVLRDFADEYLAMRRYVDYLHLFSSHQRTAALRGIEDQFSPKEFVVAAREAWVGDDQPSVNHAFWRKALRACRASPEVFMRADERHTLAAMPATVDVFRGCGPAEDRPKGFAWTLDRKQAEFFAYDYRRGGRSRGHVLNATVRSCNAIAYLGERQEQELLFFPQAARDWRKV